MGMHCGDSWAAFRGFAVQMYRGITHMQVGAVGDESSDCLGLALCSGTRKRARVLGAVLAQHCYHGGVAVVLVVPFSQSEWRPARRRDKPEVGLDFE